MKKVINITGIPVVKFINGRNGEFRVITKVRAGFFSTHECRDFENKEYSKNPARILSAYKKGALHSVEFKSEDSTTWLTVFAKVGKKIKLVDEDILRTLDVGTINQLWFDTELYNQNQYRAVNSKTWADMAFVEN